jgi:Family of unknown function (DUF6221)
LGMEGSDEGVGAAVVSDLDGLIAFLAARLDEDEAAAKAASGLNWEYRDSWVWAGSSFEVADVYGIPDIDETGTHIARHDPARALRDAVADRKLIAAYENVAEFSDPWIGLDLAVRIRAERFSGHPAYREEWAPE